MKIVIAHDSILPATTYGGIERVIWWLGKGLYELGHKVIIACRKKSMECPFAELICVNFKEKNLILPDGDIYHFHAPLKGEFLKPYIVTIHGNGKNGETFPINTVFVSKDHAKRHGSISYVYNGIDPSEYIFSKDKKNYFVFLAKASWRVKNVKLAIKLSRATRNNLHVIGGKSLFVRRKGIVWHGMLGGEKKAHIISHARALLNPVIWHEPFGLAVIESLISGTPVIASSFGSMKELIPPSVGFICSTEKEFIEAIKVCDMIDPYRCRDWAMKFNYIDMAKKYVELYERVLSGEKLNPSQPRTIVNFNEGCEIPVL